MPADLVCEARTLQKRNGRMGGDHGGGAWVGAPPPWKPVSSRRLLGAGPGYQPMWLNIISAPC
jgi:hypothetical protein